MYRNNGDGTFTDVTKASGLDRTDGKALGVVFADYDNDGRVDLFVANDLTRNFLYHNEAKGTFKEVGLPAGVALASDGRVRAGMGTDFGDYDGDGLPDLVVTNFESETHSLFRNLGKGLFADATFESGVGPVTLPFLGFGVAFFDYDNDADLDLAIANGHVLDNTRLFRSTSRYAQRNLLLRNDANGRFAEVGRQSGPGLGTGEGEQGAREPATSTTTAIWICWSATMASRPTCFATMAGRVRAMRCWYGCEVARATGTGSGRSSRPRSGRGGWSARCAQGPATSGRMTCEYISAWGARRPWTASTSDGRAGGLKP